MYSRSRFILAAVTALGVSVASAGFLAARRAYSSPAPASPMVSSLTPQQQGTAGEPTPTALPSPVASPEPVASAEVESAEPVLSKAAEPRPTARTVTKARTPAPAPAREVAVTRPATSALPPRQAPAPEPVVETPTPAPPVRKPTVEPVPAPPPPAPVETAPTETPRRQFEEHTVRADSMLGVRIDQTLSSATARLEDRVTGSMSRDLIVDGRTVLPAGTRLEGTVTLVQPGSKFKGRARLGIRFHTIVLADGLRVPIQTETLYRDGESATGSTAAKVGTGATAGAILGGMLGGKRGAIIGAGVGAAGGTAAVMAGDAKDALLQSGTSLTMRLTSPVTLTIERESSWR